MRTVVQWNSLQGGHGSCRIKNVTKMSTIRRSGSTNPTGPATALQGVVGQSQQLHVGHNSLQWRILRMTAFFIRGVAAGIVAAEAAARIRTDVLI